MKLTLTSVFLPLLVAALPHPEAQPVSDALPFDHALQKRQVCTSRQYCLIGWDQTGFRGNLAQRCCYWGQCCGFSDDLLVNHLLSAKASGVAGIYLYTDSVCQTDATRLLIDQEGYSNLGFAPAFHSVNMDG